MEKGEAKMFFKAYWINKNFRLSLTPIHGARALSFLYQ